MTLDTLAIITKKGFDELRGEMGQMRDELRGEMNDMKVELTYRIDNKIDELKDEFRTFRDEILTGEDKVMGDQKKIGLEM